MAKNPEPAPTPKLSGDQFTKDELETPKFSKEQKRAQKEMAERVAEEEAATKRALAKAKEDSDRHDEFVRAGKFDEGNSAPVEPEQPVLDLNPSDKVPDNNS